MQAPRTAVMIQRDVNSATQERSRLLTRRSAAIANAAESLSVIDSDTLDRVKPLIKPENYEELEAAYYHAIALQQKTKGMLRGFLFSHSPEEQQAIADAQATIKKLIDPDLISAVPEYGKLLTVLNDRLKYNEARLTELAAEVPAAEAPPSLFDAQAAIVTANPQPQKYLAPLTRRPDATVTTRTTTTNYEEQPSTTTYVEDGGSIIGDVIDAIITTEIIDSVLDSGSSFFD